MCRVEQADWATFQNVTNPRARKEHRCGECRRTIPVGEQYERTSGLYDSKWDVYCTCQHCQRARLWLERECGGWVYTEVCEELIEHWQEDELYRSFWLAHVIAGMKHRWHDGRLPVPEQPPLTVA